MGCGGQVRTAVFSGFTDNPLGAGALSDKCVEPAGWTSPGPGSASRITPRLRTIDELFPRSMCTPCPLPNCATLITGRNSGMVVATERQSGLMCWSSLKSTVRDSEDKVEAPTPVISPVFGDQLFDHCPRKCASSQVGNPVVQSGCSLAINFVRNSLCQCRQSERAQHEPAEAPGVLVRGVRQVGELVHRDCLKPVHWIRSC